MMVDQGSHLNIKHIRISVYVGCQSGVISSTTNPYFLKNTFGD